MTLLCWCLKLMICLLGSKQEALAAALAPLQGSCLENPRDRGAW